MRILHTSDWHLGARLTNGESRIEEQKQVLEEICRIADERDVQLIVISGDVYHHYNPSTEAENLFYRTLAHLSHRGERAVAVIAGNHDNPERLCVAEPFYFAHGILIVGGYGHSFSLPDSAEIKDLGGNCFIVKTRMMSEAAVIAALPHASEGRLRATYESITGKDGAGYADALKHLFSESEKRFEKGAVNILASHLFVMGGAYAGDELKGTAIGGTEGVPLSAFPAGADYCALGHLHRPQLLGRNGTIAYCGSPLQYHLDGGGKRCVFLVNIRPGEKAAVSEIPLTSGKAMACWQAEDFDQALQFCRSDRDRGAWILLKVMVKEPLKPSQVAELRAERGNDLFAVMPMYPDAVMGEERPDIAGLKDEELFTEFYKTKMKHEPSRQVVELFLRLSAEAGACGEGEDETSLA